MNTDTNVVSLENTLEHIVSQKDKDKLEYKNNIHKLGNLTLLECKNSENGVLFNGDKWKISTKINDSSPLMPKL